ncbi:MAG: CinA family nicotinamide mononucleotide deamidase-related protein [Chloroflexi bacterium]|nr:CinA family nicotinamide mononucleotide deamidase-related protein [Chloroflexota bacterium]
MPDNTNAELIAIGTELLLGEITDTNSVYLARQLRDIGINLFLMTTVGDNLTRISTAISDALDRAEIVITTGGLGPTVDDMTRQAVADAVGVPLVFHQSLYDVIADRFRGFGSAMTANNRQQAWLPEAALLIENPVGTAPSFIVESARGVVISLPGVPREMKYLMRESVVPWLLQKYQLGVIVARTLRTAGVGESALDDQIGADLLSERNPSVGLAAHHGCVDVRITAKAADREAAQELLDTMQVRLHRRIGQHIFGSDDDTLEEVVWRQLAQRQGVVHVLEAGLPGVISAGWKSANSRLNLQQFDSPVDLYAALAQDPRSMSLAELAVEIAQRSRQQMEAAASIVVLCTPDLDESPDMEQGSAVAVATEKSVRFRAYGFGARSSLAREWISRWGLANLWRQLNAEQAAS